MLLNEYNDIKMKHITFHNCYLNTPLPPCQKKTEILASYNIKLYISKGFQSTLTTGNYFYLRNRQSQSVVPGMESLRKINYWPTQKASTSYELIHNWTNLGLPCLLTHSCRYSKWKQQTCTPQNHTIPILWKQLSFQYVHTPTAAHEAKKGAVIRWTKLHEKPHYLYYPPLRGLFK